MEHQAWCRNAGYVVLAVGNSQFLIHQDTSVAGRLLLMSPYHLRLDDFGIPLPAS